MDSNIKLAANFLARCPSCLTNLLAHICDFTCAPDQSRFVNVTETAVTALGKTVITGIDVYISESYMSGVFNSCIQVSVPSTGNLALELMCGQWGASRCTPRKWFDYMGDPALNTYVPFKVAYVSVPSTNASIDGFQVLNPEIRACNVPVNSFTPACSCMDCEASCPADPPPHLPDRPCRLLGIDCYHIMMLSLFVFGSMAFLLVVNFEEKLMLSECDELARYYATCCVDSEKTLRGGQTTHYHELLCE
ncbi:hypothetical protein J6590_045800 [Homalodisca vitripennis]|nr:hypothetical protein J6590_045800 [Homalodisca vitripennis]